MYQPSLSQLLLSSLLLRLCLILYGELHDRASLLKYTDVDYRVFTDAARHVIEGASPYLRHTYRYTPLLALLLQPNILLCNCFGKVIFSVCDLVIGYLIHSLLSHDGHSPTTSLVGAALWLLNPLAAGVSTRGNAESLLGCLVLSTLLVARQGRAAWAGVLLALAVHLKIYPIVYSLPLFLHLGYCTGAVRGFLTPSTVTFVVSFVTVQTALLFLFWSLYGYEFLYETYLYHVVRSDTRHNFSPYFYLLYLSKYSANPFLSSLLKFMSFVPQALLCFLFGVKLFTKLELCLAVQTISFVMLNKVATSQYFLWYLWLVPLTYPHVRAFSLTRILCFVLPWVLCQAAWLLTGYLVEFMSHNAFLAMHFAGIGFLLAHSSMVYNLIR